MAERARPGFVYLAAVVLATGFWLFTSRDWWFMYDEWDFFVTVDPALHKDLVAGLLAPHANHWSTLVYIDWEAVYHLVGLRVYRIYQLPTIAFHLGVVTLSRAVMLRAGVRPWPATLASLLLLVPGVGANDVVFGWQVQFAGAVFFGLGMLLLSDHDGAPDVRDALGVVSALLALMCGLVAVPMIFATGLSLALRRRFRAAAVAVVPAMLAFVAWYAAYGHVGVRRPTTDTLAMAPAYAAAGLTASLDSLLGVPEVGGAALLAVGLGLALLGVDPRRRGSAPVYALAGGAVAFFLITAVGRVSFVDPSAPRYIYVGVVLLMPSVALVVDRMSTSRPASLAAAALLCWALLANVGAAYIFVHRYAEVSQNEHRIVNGLARDPALDGKDQNGTLGVEGTQSLTFGTIRRLRDLGQLPA